MRRFNASLAAGALLCAFAGGGCKKGEEAADAGAKAPPTRAVPPPAVDVPPAQVVQDLPSLPAMLGVKPGDTLAALKAARPRVSEDPLTPAILFERLDDDGPFVEATYLLTRDGGPPRVQTIVLELQSAYAHAQHFGALERSIADKVGAGKPVAHEGFTGLEWAVPGHRIELRRDTRRDDAPELVFDLRGAREIEMP